MTDYHLVLAVHEVDGTEADAAQINGTCWGTPNFSEINNSCVERQNLTMRMSVKRFARKKNAFSKKFKNHVAALALYFTYYNFCRTHITLDTTRAIAAGLDDTQRDLEWVIGMIDAQTPAPRRGPYRRRRRVRVA